MLKYLNQRLSTLDSDIKNVTSSSKKFPLLAKEKKEILLAIKKIEDFVNKSNCIVTKLTDGKFSSVDDAPAESIIIACRFLRSKE